MYLTKLKTTSHAVIKTIIVQFIILKNGNFFLNRWKMEWNTLHFSTKRRNVDAIATFIFFPYQHKNIVPHDDVKYTCVTSINYFLYNVTRFYKFYFRLNSIVQS